MEESNSLRVYQEMLSSSVGAVFVSVFMTPLDVVKIRLQSQSKARPLISSSSSSWSLCPFESFNFQRTHLSHSYFSNRKKEQKMGIKSINGSIKEISFLNRSHYLNGTCDAFIKIYRSEGISSFWSGLSPALALSLPTTVIYFTIYEHLASLQSPSFPQEIHLALSGGGARLVAVALTSPLELIRTEMQSKRMTFSDVRNSLRVNIQKSGVLGLWKGFSATLFRDVPFSALYWPLYNRIKKSLSASDKLSALTLSFSSGALAGGVASAITLPMDVVKTQRQIGKVSSKKSNVSVGVDIWRREGARGLYSGLTPRLLKVAPSCAIMISSYEYCKRAFIHYNHSSSALKY